jgi:hypothetical protein
VMIIMYALVFRTTIVDVLVIFRIIAGHETTREQVTLQVCGIRVDQAPEFACSTWTSYVGSFVHPHVGHHAFLVSSHLTFAHVSDHGCLRGIE